MRLQHRNLGHEIVIIFRPSFHESTVANNGRELEGLRKEIWDLRQRSDRRSDFDHDMKDVIEEVRGANEITMGNINRLWAGVENQQAWASSLSYKVKDIESFLENCNENEDVDGV